jgi:class 3 adenylate cyclase
MEGDVGPGETSAIPAQLVIASHSGSEQAVPVYDWLVVGRECAGVDRWHRLVIDDPAVSRTHLEVRLDFERDHAWATDHSTNGTRLNGQRIARAIPARIRPGDRVVVGSTELQFRSERFESISDVGDADPARDRSTLRQITVPEMVMVVGDIVGFSAIAEHTDDRVLLENIDRLYTGLRQILARHHGTLSNYAGDAFFATWDCIPSPESEAPEHSAPDRGITFAARAAVGFAVAAAEAVPRIGAGLDLRDPAGDTVRMGWGVARGPAAVSQLTGMLVTVLGDTTNVAFRLSGIAGRDGRPDVLVTRAVHQVTATSFAFTAPSSIQLKGRAQSVEVLGASHL